MNQTLAYMHKRLIVYAAIFTSGFVPTALFIVTCEYAAAAVCGVFSVATAVALYQQARRVYWIKLIYESNLLTVPTAIISGPEGAQISSEIVIAAFGLMLGDKPYPWGCGNGVRLCALRIDARTIHLAFGEDGAKRQVVFLHGMADAAQIAQFAEKLRFETGVIAEVFLEKE